MQLVFLKLYWLVIKDGVLIVGGVGVLRLR